MVSVMHVSTSIVAASVRNLVAPALSFPSYMSLPVPRLSEIEQGERRVHLFVGRGEIVDRERGYEIWAPRFLVSFQSRSGRLVSLRPLTRQEAGGDPSLEQPIGTGIPPLEKTEASFLERHLLVCVACDVLLDRESDPAGRTEAVKELESRLARASEPALLPYLVRLLYL